MARQSSGGPGCFGIVVGLVVLGWVIEHLAAVLTVAAVVAAIAVIGWTADAWAKRAAIRRRCPVCGNWVASVIMTELDTSTRPLLCPVHARHLLRIELLEAELLEVDPPDP